MPQESCSSQEVSIGGLLLSFIELEHECVDGLLVDVAAFFVVENEGDSGRVLDFAPVLVFRKLSDSLCDTPFVVDAEGLPKAQEWVLALL
jgi:hypothetical protein